METMKIKFDNLLDADTGLPLEIETPPLTELQRNLIKFNMEQWELAAEASAREFQNMMGKIK